MGILNEIEQHEKKNNHKKFIVIGLLFFVGASASYYYIDLGNNEVVQKEVKTYTVSVGDLKTSISGDGKILYKEDFNLNFPISGTVKSINKNEGDIVKSGDTISTLYTTYLELAVDKAEISLKKAESDLLAKKNQYSSSDIKLSQDQFDSVKVNLENVKLAGEVDVENVKYSIVTAEISLASSKKDLESAKSNLEIIKKQEQEKYDNKLEDIITTIGGNVSFMKENILKIDKLLGVTKENKNYNDEFEDYLGIKDTSLKNEAKSSFINLDKEFNLFLDEWKPYRQGEKNLTKVGDFLDEAEANSRLLNHSLGLTLETIKNSIDSSRFTKQDIDSYINDYENAILATKNELGGLINSRQSAEEQKTSMEVKITAQKNIIASLEGKVELAKQKLNELNLNLSNSIKKAENNLVLAKKQIDIAKSSLATKTEAPSYSELAPYYTNIENAKKSLEETKRKLEDAVLKSPIDGKIVKINGNIGSFVGGDKDSSFVTITNNNKFYVESYVEELDIMRIVKDGKVYLTFDAVDGLSLEGKVYYISDKSTADLNGVVTYKVEIEFDPKNSGIREGMTTYIEYITNEVKNAKIVPVSAVKPVNGKPSVMLENGKYKEILTGFTDAKMVEIISGLNKGDKIIY